MSTMIAETAPRVLLRPDARTFVLLEVQAFELSLA